MVSLEILGVSFLLFGAGSVLFLTLTFFLLLFFVSPFTRSIRPHEPAWRKTAVVLLTIYVSLLVIISAFTSTPAYVKQTLGLPVGIFHPQYQQQQQQQPEEPYLPHRQPQPLFSSPIQERQAEFFTSQAFSPSLHQSFPEFAFVTFATDGYFDALENLIGSLKVWGRHVPILVYNMGLSPEHRSFIAGLENVQLIHFNFSQHPPHLKFMHNYAFKPLLLLDALQRAKMILSLDAGVEVRGSLQRVVQAIDTVGYFFVEASAKDPLSRVHPDTVRWLNLPSPSPSERMCYGGMQGYRRDSLAAREVLAEGARCALDPRCMDPLGSGHENHRYEQSVMSLLARHHRLHCAQDEGLSEHRPATLHPNPLAANQPQTFFLRRWRYPKPYAKFISSDAPTPSSLGEQAAVSIPVKALARMAEGEVKTGYVDDQDSFYESGVTDRKMSDNKALQCLQRTAYDLTLCKQELLDTRAQEKTTVRLGSIAYRKQQEFDGWLTTRLAQLYWYWPLSFANAVFLSAVLVYVFLSLFNTHRLRITHVCIGLAAFYIVWRILSGNCPSLHNACQAGFPIHFEQNLDNTDRTPIDPFFMQVRGQAECLGPGDHLVTLSSPSFVAAMRPPLSQEYAFYSTYANGHTLVGYAAFIHVNRALTPTLDGVLGGGGST